MIEKFCFPTFKRQKEVFPGMISSIEGIARQREITRSTVFRLGMIAHDLRNHLTIVSAVLELEELEHIAPQTV